MGESVSNPCWPKNFLRHSVSQVKSCQLLISLGHRLSGGFFVIVADHPRRGISLATIMPSPSCSH